MSVDQRQSSPAKVTVHTLAGDDWQHAEIPSAAGDLLSDSSHMVWIDVEGNPEEAKQALVRILNACPEELHGVDAGRATEGGEHPPRRPPKAKALPNTVFARAYWLGTSGAGKSEPVIAHEVHVLSGKTFAITIRYPKHGWDMRGDALTPRDIPAGSPGFKLEDAQRDVLELRQRRDPDGVGKEAFGLEVAAVVVDNIVDSVFDVLNALRLRIDDLEGDVVAGEWLADRNKNGSSSLPEQTLGMRRLLRQIRWAFLPSDEISELLSGPLRDLKDQRLQFKFDDLSREAERAVETVRDTTEQVQHTVELSNTMKADRLNDTLYVLTVVATVFLVPTLIAGIFGMNFRNLPGTETLMGFWGSLIAMAGVGVGVWYAINRYLRSLYKRRTSSRE